MKLYKIAMAVLWVALLLNCVANVWIENYTFAGMIGVCLLWMVAYFLQTLVIERLRRIADREDRWDLNWHEARRWLAEFPDAADALDHVRREVDGVRPFDIQILRDNMRARRDEAA